MHRPQHNAHVGAHLDHLMDEILAVLRPGVPAGWADWSRYAAAGEW
jgi:hypothetical protein